MSFQNIRGITTATPTGTQYCGFMGNVTTWSTEGAVRSMIRGTGKLKTGGKITIATAPGVGTSHIYTVRDDGAGTSYVITISDNNTTGIYAGADVTISDQSLVCIEHTVTGSPASPGIMKWVFPYEPDTNKESVYTFTTGTANTTPDIIWSGVFNQINAFEESAAASVTQEITCAGSIRGTGIVVSSNPGVGNGIVCYVNLNGTRQDGGGGSVNTACSMINTDRAFSDYDLPVVPGDKVYLEWDITGAFTVRNFGQGILFRATTPGDSIIAGKSGTLNTSSTQYTPPVAYSSMLDTVEANFGSSVPGGFYNSSLSSLYVRHSVAPGSGKSYTTNGRINSGVTNLSVQVSDLATEGEDTVGSSPLTSSDYFNMQFVPAGTPTASVAFWSMTESIPVGGGGGQGITKGGKGSKGVGGKQLFGVTNFIQWDTINTFGQ